MSPNSNTSNISDIFIIANTTNTLLILLTTMIFLVLMILLLFLFCFIFLILLIFRILLIINIKGNINSDILNISDTSDIYCTSNTPDTLDISS